MSSSSLFVRGAFVIAAASLAACASPSGGSLVPVPGLLVPNVAELAVPKPCAGQKTTAKSASLTQKLSTKGGSFCIPAFKGFGGTIFYPAVSPSVKLAVASSTTNYDHKMPPLGPGSAKVLFYLQIATNGGTTFSPSVPAGGGLSSKSIIDGKPYTAFGQASADGIVENLTACYTIATKGKYGGEIGGVGSLLKGKYIPVPASGFIEIYPGKLASGKC